MIKRALMSLLLTVLALPVFISGCSNAAGNEMENDMDNKPSTPLIDLKVPKHTETATFGLG